jgi:hypothetical protein
LICCGEPTFAAALEFIFVGLLAVPLGPVFDDLLTDPVAGLLGLFAEAAGTFAVLPGLAPLICCGEPALVAALEFTFAGLRAVPLLPTLDGFPGFLAVPVLVSGARTADAPRDSAGASTIIPLLRIFSPPQ